MKAHRITLVVAAKTDEGFDEALDEAVRRIKAGNLLGTDGNADSGFYFGVDTEIEPGEMPAHGPT